MTRQPEPRIAAAVQGDTDALTALLEEHGPAVRRKLTINPRWRGVLEPADVMQVTYLEAFLEIGQLEFHTVEAFATWLKRLADNNLRDGIKELQRQKRPNPRLRVLAAGDTSSASTPLSGLSAPGFQTPSRVIAGKESHAALAAAMSKLPPPYAQAVRLHDLEGRPLAEVAARLGRSRGAVCMLRARGLDRLRLLLGPESHFFTDAP
jgi:RNA polymerase sigma-70 factor (ECF subfamily)